ncbi:MAG: DUF222 domain-containing protein [Acidimicrobiia bacterium]|nr:DUF222 domain-containing protein [Acidimicrobiia bacterium]
MQETDAIDAAVRDVAEVCGIINAAEARLVAIIARVLEGELWVGHGILSPEHWVAWRCGVSAGRARQLVSIARRREELPLHAALLDAGEITVDQAAIVAKYAPAEKDEDIAGQTPQMTVSQLSRILSKYQFSDEPTPTEPVEERRSMGFGADEHRWWLRAEAPLDEGATIEAALVAARDRLFNDAAGTEDRAAIDWIDALLLVCERSQRAGASERPDSDRHRVLWHLDCEHDETDTLRLQAHLGSVLPDRLRRYLLCDATVAPVLRVDGVPVSVGRAQHIVPDRTRRLVERRDGGCRVPGCPNSRGIQVHHIVHWEDGGPTDTDNLCCLCRRHHRLLHNGVISITGDADDPDGLTVTDRWNRRLDPTGKPIPPNRSPGDAARAADIPTPTYRHPSGEAISTRDAWFGDATAA